MGNDLRGFWLRLQRGVEATVAAPAPEKLLGVRDGFLRYFRQGLDWPVSVVVVPGQAPTERVPLLLSEEEILRLARRRAAELGAAAGRRYPFQVAAEEGVVPVESGGEVRHVVRTWVVVRALGDEAWGSSGSVQLPQLLVRGVEQERMSSAVPGTRRRGGMVSSLTEGLENRRLATALATLHALSSLLYGVVERRSLPSLPRLR